MPATETTILTGLLDHFKLLSLASSLPVAWPNVAFDPPSSAYLAVQHFPTPPFQVELGDAGRNRFEGTLQISVFVPRLRGGIDGAEYGGQIAAHFKRGTRITAGSIIIRIDRPPHVGPLLVEDTHAQTPVSIRYQCDAANP